MIHGLQQIIMEEYDSGVKAGEEKGEIKKLIEMVCKKIRKGKSPETIAEELEEDYSSVLSIYHAAEKCMPACDCDKIYELLKEEGTVCQTDQQMPGLDYRMGMSVSGGRGRIPMLRGCFIEKLIRVTSLFTIFEVTRPQDYIFEGESHDFWEIVYVVEGKLGVTAGADLFRLEPGRAVIHRPMEFHCLWSEENTCPHIIVISFSAEKMPEFSGKLFSLEQKDAQELLNLSREAHNLFGFDGIQVSCVPAGREREAHTILQPWLYGQRNQGNV